MGKIDDNGFSVKEDGTIVRSVTSSKIEIFKKKISHKNEVIDNVGSEEGDILLCPECYSDDVTNDGSDYLQYMCNECGLIWGNRNDVECPECGSLDVMDNGSECLQFKCNNCGNTWDELDEVEGVEMEDEYEDELHKFFPVAGITLDETTVEEVEAQENMYDSIDYEDDGTVIVWYEDIQIIKDSDRDSFSDVHMIYDDSMLKKWKDIGFSWDLSYTEWKNLFQNMGYDVRIKEKPRKIFYKERGYWYLNAKIVAIAQDHSISFELDFSYGEYGYDVFSKKTLFSIDCYGKELTKEFYL